MANEYQNLLFYLHWYGVLIFINEDELTPQEKEERKFQNTHFQNQEGEERIERF